MEELIPIGRLAKKLGVSTRTIRYYEDLGLIRSIRDRSSNYRLYDGAAVARLEQILLFRDLQFPLSEITEILTAQNNESAVRLFSEKLAGLERTIRELSFYSDIIGTFVKISEEKGADNINIYELLREQIYVHRENERMMEMENRYKDEIIRIEFGTGLIPMADREKGGDLIDRIKALRSGLEAELGFELPLIRLRDNVRLGERKYTISIKDALICEEELGALSPSESAEAAAARLREEIIRHKEQIKG